MERTRMKRRFSMRWSLLAAGAATLVTVAAMGGCELIVDFDRSKIPVGDASDLDVTITDDGPEESALRDAPGDRSVAPDAGGDAAADAPPVLDGTVDANVSDDAETPESGTSESGTPESGTPDTGAADAPIDVVTPVDAGSDAPSDDASD
jgi:hypothetical protein